MNTPSAFFSLAYNFASAVAGGVDPRTGQFNITLTLANLTSNNGLGPSVPIELNYSPSSGTDMGFGVGFDLGLTTYNAGSGNLSLSTGEQYQVWASQNSGAMGIQQTTLKHVSIQRTPDGQYYQVTYRDGTIELLDGPNNAGDLKQLRQIISPSGHNLYFQTDAAGRLSTIKDDDLKVLVSISYSSARSVNPIISILPGWSEGYDVFLDLQGKYLVGISSNALGAADTSLKWLINYTDMSFLGPWGLWATKLIAPGGLVEEVAYSPNADLAHRYVESASDMRSVRMPYVVQLTTTPGGGQPAILQNYAFSSANFLGCGAGTNWNPALDPLYDCSFDYKYKSTVTHIDDANIETAVERTYNCFHLQVKEATRRDDHVIIEETTYYATPGMGFAAQDPRFQLPRLQTISCSSGTLEPDGQVSRKAQIQYNYDLFGNQLSQAKYVTDDNGALIAQGAISWDYYPAAGLANDIVNGFGCPPDPNTYNRQNSVPRFIKSMTTTPAQSDYGDEPIVVTRYRYQQYAYPAGIPALAGAYTVFNCEQRAFSDTHVTARTTFQYAAASQGHEFGRLVASSRTHYPDENPDHGYTTTSTMTAQLSGEKLTRTTTQVTHDSITTTASKIASRFTGRVTETINNLGVKNTGSYDKLGRLTSVTTASGTDFANTRDFAYTIGSAATAPYIIMATDALGNQVRTSFDGMKNALKGEVQLKDGSIWQILQTRTYDNAGRLQSTVSQDFNSNTSTPYASLSSDLHYDNWGQSDCATGPDGIQSFNIKDPVLLTNTAYDLSGRPDPATGQLLQTSRTVQSYDVARRTVTTKTYAAGSAIDSTPYSTTSAKYDGLNRLRSMIDALGRETSYVYDAFGRVITAILPKTSSQQAPTVVARIYNDDTPSAVMVNITVDDVSMGTRIVDGMGRITQQDVGGHLWQAEYDPVCGSLTSPSSITSPYGVTVNYSYQPELNGKLISKSVGPDPVRGTVINHDSLSLSYNAITGKLACATSFASSRAVSIANTFDVNGRLSAETFSQGGGTTSYQYTTAGQIKSYTDVTGAKREVTARDAYGRPTQASDRDVQLDVIYDVLGRLSKWIATDLSNTSHPTLTTTITWDDLDREASRKVESSHGSAWILEQSYYKSHQLQSKTLKRGTTGTTESGFTIARQESFQYDARNRLIAYEAEGPELPANSKGRRLKSQRFVYDAYDNITRADTVFDDGSSDIMTCLFTPKDPCQLRIIRHTHSDYPLKTTLTYDAAGNIINDGQSRSFSYDHAINCGYLRSVTQYNEDGIRTATSGFFYDPLNRMIDENGTNLFYRGSRLVSQINGDNKVRLVPGPTGNLAQVREGAHTGIWLSGVDASGSVLSLNNDDTRQTMAYGPHGEQPADDDQTSILGYNGRRKSAVLEGYHLGNGYRLYSPELRRFMAPDSYSPFGKGGINPYAYCAGDPVNNTDPTGHSWKGVLKFRHEVMHVATKPLHLAEKGIHKAEVAIMPSKIERIIVNTAIVVVASIEDPVIGADAAETAGDDLLAKGGKDAVKGTEDIAIDAPKTVEPSAPPMEGPSAPPLEHESLQGAGEQAPQHALHEIFGSEPDLDDLIGHREEEENLERFRDADEDELEEQIRDRFRESVRLDRRMRANAELRERMMNEMPDEGYSEDNDDNTRGIVADRQAMINNIFEENRGLRIIRNRLDRERYILSGYRRDPF